MTGLCQNSQTSLIIHHSHKMQQFLILTPLHSEWPKLYGVLAFPSAIGLTTSIGTNQNYNNDRLFITNRNKAHHKSMAGGNFSISMTPNLPDMYNAMTKSDTVCHNFSKIFFLYIFLFTLNMQHKPYSIRKQPKVIVLFIQCCQYNIY